MSGKQNVNDGQVEPSGSAPPTWWVMFSRELRDLWVGGKALHLILIYSVLLGIYSYLLASNAEVNLMPLREMVLEMVKASIAVGLFISLIIGADSVSGERERATLESLLLTPTSRRQILVGKFLAAVSPWPVALAIAIPYWAVLSKGDAVFGQAVLWGVLLGSLLAPAFAGLGMLVSIWSNTNKMSMLVSLCLYLLLLLPTKLMLGPAKIQRTAEQWFRAELNQWVNPMAATSRFLFKVLVNNLPPAGLWFWHTTPVLFAVLVLVLLFMYAGPSLRLDAETARKFQSYWARWRRVFSLSVPRPVLREDPSEPEGGRPQDVLPHPTAEAHQMSDKQRVNDSRVEPSGSASPTWWLVFRRELRDLWIGGRALYLTLIYTILLGIYSYVMARDSVLSLIPPQEMVYEMLKAAIVASVFVGVIIGADSLSGERERATLEGLLLTPTSRRQIVVGKFFAAISPWPVALAITIPYMKVLSQGDAVFGQAVLWGGVLGSALTPAFTALGMFVGFWCNTNKTSMFVSLCLYLLFLLPTQLPGSAQAGAVGQFFQWVNPMGAPRVFLAGMLVNNRPLARTGPWLLSPFVFAILVFALLFWYASPGLRLEAGKASRIGLYWRRLVGFSVIACLVGFLGTAPAMAQKAAPQEEQAALKSPERPSLQISIDLDTKVVKAGTPILYNTLVTNNGTEASPPLILAMNIINLKGSGDPVDPEDWSPQRTQYLESLAPGQAVTHSWRVNAILDGNFMVYMVVIPAPGGPEATSQPVASSGIHLTVTPFTRLNPRGVLPYAIGGPIVLGLVIFLVHRHRRRKIDPGGS
ncbi:MAG: ABC transporter permease subunit [Acidobacteria bacterium]|nr:ABC transporter permease subunit [Acidobacteriota bacterium]